MGEAGGSGGTAGLTGGDGGSGGAGRIRIEYCETLSGSPNPAASTAQLDCYMVEQIESSPYDTARLNLPESYSDGRHYWIHYGRRHVFGGAGEQTSVLRVPAGAFTDATLKALVSDVGTGSLTFRLDIGNDGSWDWQTTQSVDNAATLSSPDLSAAFSQHWATHGAPTSGNVDVPIRVYMSKGGQVLLTDLGMTPTGSKVRYARLPAMSYDSVTLDITVGDSGSGSLVVAADVGDDGTVDWTYTGSPSYPAHLTTSNLASDFNDYLSGHSGEVDVPIRFYLAPFLSLDLEDFDVIINAQPDLTATEMDISFGTVSPTEGETVPVTVTLHNNGSLEAGGVTAAFYAEAPGWGDWYVGADYVSAIPSGNTGQAVIQWNTLGFTGTVPLRVVLDPHNRLPESNEGNNEATTLYDILTRPDLLTTDFPLSDDEPVTGETVSIELPLHNRGQTTAISETVALYDGNPDSGGVSIGISDQAALPGGATATVPFDWTPVPPGPYRLFAQVDRDDEVNEYDEGNNLTWRDVYVGFAGPILIDSGMLVDQAYTEASGHGYVDEGQTDVVSSCGDAPHETLRLDPSGSIVYQFDHLLPGHFYHLDVTLYECDGAGRQESIYVDGNLVAGPEDLSDGLIHRLSVRLDPAFYADNTIRVTVESPGFDGAVVGEVNLHDIDYRYADAGGSNDPEYVTSSVEKPYGWLDGVPNTYFGTLPYESARVEQLDNAVRYRFDALDPADRYQVHLTFWQGDGGARIQNVEIDGIDMGVTVDTGDYQPHYVTVDVPPTAYAADGSIVVSIVRTNASTGAFVNEIALEQLTLTAENTLPVPDFDASPTSGYKPLTVNFTDRSSGVIDNYTWDFGDGGTDTIPNPVHTYNQAGVYTVTLEVSGPGGSNAITRTNLITITDVPADVTLMNIEPATASANAGVPLTVSVAISNVEDLGSFQFTLNYSPTLVWVQDITLGTFPGSTGRPFTPVGPTIDNTAGTAVFGGFSLGSTPPGPSGSGILAYIQLQPRSGGTAELHLSGAQAADVPGNSIQIFTQDGMLIITSCLGDFDGDGDVDIVDIQRIAYRWNSLCGDPLYDPIYDLDSDCDIDIIDIQRVAYRWGTQCAARTATTRSSARIEQPAILTVHPSTQTVTAGNSLLPASSSAMR